MNTSNFFFFDQGYSSLNKYGEELCGDKVETVIDEEQITLVLADGLGSGVKANILATLTSKILCTMLAHKIPIKDCIETIIETLPVCKVRGIAYATFSVIHLNKKGEGYLIEFDNPQAIYYKGICGDFQREKKIICERTVYKTDLKLEENDLIFLMSDGTIHAGIGAILNLGWNRESIKKYLNKNLKESLSARAAACLFAKACNDLYLNKPGDDTTVAALKIKRHTKVNILTGPPIDPEKDDFYVEKFLQNCDKKVVCGGTSSQIVARYLKKELKTNFRYLNKDIPPIAHIEGIDLTTEGVLTLRKLLQLSEKYLSVSDLDDKYYVEEDGASLLAEILFEEATDIEFFVGQNVNIAHQGLPIDTTMKLKLIESLSQNLQMMGKKVLINYI